MGGCDTTNRLSTDTYPLRGVGDSTQPKRDKQAGKQAVVHSINSFSRQFVKQSYRTLRTSTSGILINKKREGKGRKEPKKKIIIIMGGEREAIHHIIPEWADRRRDI